MQEHTCVLSAEKMRIVGLEPIRPAAQEPKSCTSANSVISANVLLPLQQKARISSEIHAYYNLCVFGVSRYLNIPYKRLNQNYTERVLFPNNFQRSVHITHDLLTGL